MKIHEGKCTTNPCNKTHAYRCRLCRTFFRQDPYRGPREMDFPFPFYPYCSVTCANAAAVGDPGYHLYSKLLTQSVEDSSATELYPNPQVHSEFNRMMEEVKAL